MLLSGELASNIHGTSCSCFQCTCSISVWDIFKQTLQGHVPNDFLPNSKWCSGWFCTPAGVLVQYFSLFYNKNCRTCHGGLGGLLFRSLPGPELCPLRYTNPKWKLYVTPNLEPSSLAIRKLVLMWYTNQPNRPPNLLWLNEDPVYEFPELPKMFNAGLC